MVWSPRAHLSINYRVRKRRTQKHPPIPQPISTQFPVLLKGCPITRTDKLGGRTKRPVKEGPGNHRDRYLMSIKDTIHMSNLVPVLDTRCKESP